jgi:hypothetical protein
MRSLRSSTLTLASIRVSARRCRHLSEPELLPDDCSVPAPALKEGDGRRTVKRSSHWSGSRLVLLVPVIAAFLVLAPGQVSAATLSVCPSGCPYTQLAPALAAARDGDTIKIGPGTYNGGVTIDVSVKLVGAGPGRTIISGGGPVVTIGEFGASAEPTVSIEAVTITGGITRSSPESTPFTGKEGIFAVGGGVEIPPNADFSGGATVTIENSVISGNRVAPRRTAPFGPPCPSGPCPFAFAGGGGIDSWGTLTLANTTVSDNRVGSASGLSELASDADGGAITNYIGPLTISDSVIHGNQASATGSNGRFAEGGAIMEFGGTLTLSNSSVTDNSAALEASLPDSVELLANGGAMHITSDVPAATISNTTISGNSVTMTNTVGDAEAFSGGIHVDLDVDFTMSNSVVADNSVTSATLAGSSGNAGGDSGAGEILGTVTNTRFTGNTVTVTSAAGNATAFAGVSIDFGSITNSAISDNHVHASGRSGTVFAAGGAIVVDEPGLTLRNTEVSGNTVDANGQSGSARGGGIYDARIAHGPPGGPLKLLNSGVTGNALSGSPGVALQGGGLYIRNRPLTLIHSAIAKNSPDQCFGC